MVHVWLTGEICFPTFVIVMRFDVFYVLVFLCRSLVVVSKC